MPTIDTMNILRPNTHSSEPVRILEGSALEGQEKYFCDESRRQGTASALAFPTTTEQVVQAILRARQDGLRVTASGARTGIAAGAVPSGGMVVSLERMTAICGLRSVGGTIRVRCQCGVLLSDLQDSVRTGAFADSATWDEASLAALEMLKEQRLFYPPDPTEMGAAIGGTVACNASGAHTFLYGATRPHVTALTVVLMDGRVLEIERGSTRADAQGRFGLGAVDGSVRWCQIPTYTWPDTKNAAGYYTAPDLDLI
ncbi:MAG: FAD-binding oxidoreductase, partial [Lentisphaeria bacterium]|nr:FAD-binding oxidoreductase [Lentisphaeria bacterium]